MGALMSGVSDQALAWLCGDWWQCCGVGGCVAVASTIKIQAAISGSNAHE